MFQHVGRRLKGRLTNLVHADRVPAVTTYHKSAADNPSGRCVHVLSLLFNGCLRWALGQQRQTLVTATVGLHKIRIGRVTASSGHAEGSTPDGWGFHSLLLGIFPGLLVIYT